MTAKHRNKQSSSEKNVSSNQDDVAKKTPKVSNGVVSPSTPGSGSGSCVKLVAVLCYIALVAAAGFAAFYLQQVLEEVHQISSSNEESVRNNADLARQLETVLQQVDSVRGSVDGLESALGTTRAELEVASRAVRRGEGETRRVEEALQRLQNELLRDLSEGIREVKEARERDFSSLETTVEERLAELSGSIAASVAEFTGAQGEAQGQLSDLKARLDDQEDPALLKQELSAIVDNVAELSTAKDAAEASADSLRAQIGAVGAELQTRNQEVASLSQEVEAIRSLVQETAGNMRQSLTGAEAGVQALIVETQSLQGGLDQATDAVQRLEKEQQAEAAGAAKRGDDLEVRVKAAEDSGESLAVSLSDLTSRVESLLAKYDSHESTLAAQGQAADKAKTGLQGELEELRSSLGELQSNVAALGSSQSQMASKDSSMGQQIEEVEEKLAAQEKSVKSDSQESRKDLETLKNAVDGLMDKAAKLESHDKAISTMQSALEKTMTFLEALSKAPKTPVVVQKVEKNENKKEV